MPQKSLLAKAARLNHDGCGICTPNLYYKSLSFDGFYDKAKDVPTSDPALIHFRWATQGSVARRNCHPFYDKKTNIYFMHNGCVDFHSWRDETDSEVFFRRVLLPCMQGDFHSDAADYITARHGNGSRFALMQGDEVRLFGTWYKYEGLLCSNLYFLGWRAR